MTERQESHMNRLVKRFVNLFVPKFTNGTIEHSGDLQDIPMLTKIKFAQEEVLDQWSYVGSLEEDLHSLVHLVLKLDDTPLRSEILRKLQGLLPEPSDLQPPEDSRSL